MVPVRALHRFLADEGRAAVDPSVHVELPRVPRGLPKALSEEQVGRLLAAPVGDGPVVLRDGAMLEVLYGTGVRVSELVGIDLGDVELDASICDTPSPPFLLDNVLARGAEILAIEPLRVGRGREIP